MSLYRHLILGLDLHPECDLTIIRKALQLAKTFAAELTVVHAVEHLNTYGIGQAYPGIIDVEAELLKMAKAELAKICIEFNISPEHQIIATGSPKTVLFQQAELKNADLIVVGSHGRHGLGLLLGSTANSVLHNSKVDVMTIRIRDDDEIC